MKKIYLLNIVIFILQISPQQPFCWGGDLYCDALFEWDIWAERVLRFKISSTLRDINSLSKTLDDNSSEFCSRNLRWTYIILATSKVNSHYYSRSGNNNDGYVRTCEINDMIMVNSRTYLMLQERRWSIFASASPCKLSFSIDPSISSAAAKSNNRIASSVHPHSPRHLATKHSTYILMVAHNNICRSDVAILRVIRLYPMHVCTRFSVGN